LRVRASLVAFAAALGAGIVDVRAAGNVSADPVAAAAAAARAKAADDAEFVCSYYFNDKNTRLTDYRLRNSSDQMRQEFGINWLHHTGPARERVFSGDYSYNVIDDLNFTLVRWPNHRDALQVLIKFDLAGGKNGKYAPTDCYLRHAHEFAPDDPEVLLLQAYYHHRKGDKEKAKSEYLQALELDPGNAEAHYNLGLLLVDLKDFKAAVAQAELVYRNGYPLIGLRNKLEKAGYSLPRKTDTKTAVPASVNSN
jgi:tetratricopeptide (TPR) repeat protein